MNPQRWQEIERLYHEALGREPADRPAFLAEACEGDAELLAEVESLLAQDASSSGAAVNFLNRPAWDANERRDSSLGHLQAGTRIGPYVIGTALGKGGMGEVYRAKDSKLDREVAIKVLPAEFARDPHRLARFEREAKVLASLNHPNIATIYGVEDSAAGRALVMELVPGQIVKGPLPLQTALAYAKQIADALEAAHEKGIIHRDLKPGNIMVTPAGVIKVLDFGLAAVSRASTPGDGNPSKSPTFTIRGTEKGMILGTAAYMSPEQASGQQVDKRADIWAFGVVLWEMLTGKQLFQGATTSHILAAVLKNELDFSQVPAPLRPLLQICLRKDPNKRLRDIVDAKLMLEQLPEIPAEAPPVAIAKSNRRLAWLAAAIAVLAIAAGTAWSTLRPTPEQPMLQMEINPPDGVKFGAGLTPFALSPDGRKLVFVGVGKGGQRMLWLRAIDAGAATVLLGTENAEIPFWSPDSRWVGFAANGKLQKIDINGRSRPQVICEIEGRAGGTWNSDGVIVFDPVGKPLQQVSAQGGNPTPVPTLDAGLPQTFRNAPYFLPDGRHLIYLSRGKSGSNVMLASLDGKLNRILIEGNAIATYASNPRGGGWILYDNPRSQLLARPFDPDKLEFTGPPAAIADEVGIGRWWYTSATGLLAFRHSYGTQYQLSWFGRDGHPQGTLGDPGLLAAPRISPDQKTVVFQRTDEQNMDIWTLDLTRNTSARFTVEPGPDTAPVWSFDGRSILYGSGRSASPNATSIMERPANGVGQGTLVVAETGSVMLPTAVSRDGRWLVFASEGIVIRSRQDANKSIRITDHETERDASISPDGRWLLYSAVPANRREVLVQAVPREAGGSAASGKWQISIAGGGQPTWRADGKEIFFVAPDGMMMAVPVESNEEVFRPGAPKPLFQTRLEFDQPNEINRGPRQYDVTADGQRFLLNQHVADAGDAPINVVVNWPKLLEKH